MITINIGKDFSPSLVYKESAFCFRDTYLSFLDNDDIWKDDATEIILDFSRVKRIGPAWSNEVFAYFRKYANTDQILKKINIINASSTKKTIIQFEIDSGYYKKDEE